MSENEAIKFHAEELKDRICVLEKHMDIDCNADKEYCRKSIEEHTKIIGLLEEIQQYRDVIDLTEIQQYGTIDPVKQSQSMQENKSFTGVELTLIASMQIELKRYRAIGTVEECRSAVEKQKPKKPTIEEDFDYGDGYVCGECGAFLHYVGDDDEHIRMNYCCC